MDDGGLEIVSNAVFGINDITCGFCFLRVNQLHIAFGVFQN